MTGIFMRTILLAASREKGMGGIFRPEQAAHPSESLSNRLI